MTPRQINEDWSYEQVFLFLNAEEDYRAKQDRAKHRPKAGGDKWANAERVNATEFLGFYKGIGN